MLNDDVAYARIDRFSPQAVDELTRRLLPLRKPGGATPSGIVLDLRSNRGGRLDQLPALASLLAPARLPVVKNIGRHKTEVLVTSFIEDSAALRWASKVPLAVLVDGRTAAGAEALAQFLREAREARLVGETTMGPAAGCQSAKAGAPC